MLLGSSFPVPINTLLSRPRSVATDFVQYVTYRSVATDFIQYVTYHVGSGDLVFEGS